MNGLASTDVKHFSASRKQAHKSDRVWLFIGLPHLTKDTKSIQGGVASNVGSNHGAPGDNIFNSHFFKHLARRPYSMAISIHVQKGIAHIAMGAESGLEGERMEGPTEGKGGRASGGFEEKRVGEGVRGKGRGLEEAEEGEGVEGVGGGGEGSDEGVPGKEGREGGEGVEECGGKREGDGGG